MSRPVRKKTHQNKQKNIALIKEIRTDKVKAIKKGNLVLNEDQVKGFLERTVNSIGTSAKVDVPKRFMGKRAYVIIIDN